MTQRELANYIVNERQADYYFTVKGNQPQLREDISFHFKDKKEADFTDKPSCDHGRIEVRKIRTTTELNEYVKFPHVRQAFTIERHITDKKSGKSSTEVVYGITSKGPEQANAEHILNVNRGHWSIENSCHYIIDWNYDEDRSRIRTGYGPENITRLRRFAVGIIKSKGVRSVAEQIRKLDHNVRMVFDYLRMSKNSAHTKAMT
ncbi:transposase IS4 [Candidatus Magnetobacterium bavaricum]|uniref:Transposase IS4 n=2 Tax=Candidatus Magnetobacterium bavaricum TaxID=29290 RepID=A0A0F3GQN3_9BACT|nr:transposase IS4 [Candidatus Magnetobacterium bavaricum]